MRDLLIQRAMISACTYKPYSRFGPPTFRDETQYAKLGSVADVDDRVDENLEKPIEHLRLLSALLWRADVVVRREDIFFENSRDVSTGLEHNTMEVIEIGVVVPINQCQRRGEAWDVECVLVVP